MKKLSKLQQLSFIIRREYLAISTSYAVLLVLMGGIFVYGLLYNYMYAPNIVTDVPVAVVDNSHSEFYPLAGCYPAHGDLCSGYGLS